MQDPKDLWHPPVLSQDRSGELDPKLGYKVTSLWDIGSYRNEPDATSHQHPKYLNRKSIHIHTPNKSHRNSSAGFSNMFHVVPFTRILKLAFPLGASHAGTEGAKGGISTGSTRTLVEVCALPTGSGRQEAETSGSSRAHLQILSPG